MLLESAQLAPSKEMTCGTYIETDWEDMFAGVASPLREPLFEEEANFPSQTSKPRKLPKLNPPENVQVLPLNLDDPLESMETPHHGTAFRFRGKKLHLTYPSHLPMELLKAFLERFSPLKWYVVFTVSMVAV